MWGHVPVSVFTTAISLETSVASSKRPAHIPVMTSTREQIERAIVQIQHKDPLPEIDFTQHQLENGFTISTQERVVKEVHS